MAKVIIGNASAITVPRQDRASIRRFYCDVFGGKIVKEDNQKDIFRLEEDVYMLFRYGDVPDESEFLRSPRALWLQIKSDNVEEMKRKILDFGARKIDLPLPDLYFQAPGGQCFQLLPINEDQSYYKGTGDGPNLAKEKEVEALKEKAMSELALRFGQKAKSTFVYVTYIRTTPEKLWSALTDVEFMKQYWFGVHCESQWTAGSLWKMVYPDGRITDAGEIVEADPPRRLVIRWQHQNKPELKAEGESHCTIELESSGPAAKLSITHTIEREPSNFIVAVSGAWPMVISNLKSLLETGSTVLQAAYPIESAHSGKGVTMAKVIFGNHSAVMVPRTERDRIRKFYCDVLGCKITSEEDQKDLLRMGDNFYMAFLYGDHADESEFLRTGKSVFLEIKSDNVEELRRRILDFGVRKLEVPDPHLYFQAPGGQVLRLVGINEDLSHYEGKGEGPNVGKIKEAQRKGF